MTKPAASGERIIASARSYKWQDFGECYAIWYSPKRRRLIDHSVVAASKISSKVQPLETPYDATQEVYMVVYDNTKSKEALGMTYRSIEETTADILNDWETRGWM